MTAQLLELREVPAGNPLAPIYAKMNKQVEDCIIRHRGERFLEQVKATLARVPDISDDEAGYGPVLAYFLVCLSTTRAMERRGIAYSRDDFHVQPLTIRNARLFARLIFAGAVGRPAVVQALPGIPTPYRLMEGGSL